jgi:hypothetical protein
MTADALTVRRARDLAALDGHPGVRSLTLVACDLAALPPLPALEHIRVVASRIGSATALLDCAGLTRDLLWSTFAGPAAHDDQVLLAAGRGIVAGVPHSRGAARYRAELGEVASEYERQQCVRLWSATGAVYGNGVLVRPGTAFAAARMSAVDLERELDAPRFSLPELLRRYPAVTDVEPEALGDRPPPVLAWAAAAGLGLDDRLGLERFAQRFPGVGLRTDPVDLRAGLGGYLSYVRRARWLPLRGTPPLVLGRLPGRAWVFGLRGDVIARDGTGAELVAGDDERVRLGGAVVYRSLRDLLDDVSRPAAA